MKALVYDQNQGGWESTRGLWLVDVPRPVLAVGDEENVILKLKYAGFCGSDRGIWARAAFGELIQNSLKKENKTIRVGGHEFLAEVAETGGRVAEKYNIKSGDIVSAESHITCGKCYQCLAGDKHVCADDIIIGISSDGCFAEYAKLPAKILWPTDISKIDPIIAAVQEPFGNAVHACTQTDLKNKSVAVFGCGAIGSMVIMVARALGARQVIGIDPNEENVALARSVGATEAFVCARQTDQNRPWARDPAVVAKVRALTGGVGVDVAMEMAGYNSSVNSVVGSTRRGGHAVFFGLKSGDFVLESFETIIRNGLQMHCVIGRQIFGTWEITKKILEDKSNGVQDKIKKFVLNDYQGSVVKFTEFDREKFEQKLKEHTKLVFEF